MNFKLTLILLLFLLTVSNHPQGAHSVDFLVKSPFCRVDVTIFDNVVYAPVSVNGSEPREFVLDSGAPDLSIVDLELAKNFDLQTDEGGTLSGAGERNIRFVHLSGVEFSMPGLSLKGFRTGAFSLGFMEPYWGRPKHGLIGGNILSRLVTEINFTDSILIFHDPQKFSYTGSGTVIPLIVKDNAIYIKAKVLLSPDGKPAEGLFLIDTAVRNSFFNAPFTRKNRLIEQSTAIIENITGFGIGGESFGKQTRLHSIDIGGYSLSAPVIELSTDTKGVAASKNFDGMIGADILSRFHVILDYQGSRIILEPNSRFNEPFLYDMSGMYLVRSEEYPGYYEAAYIIKDSPAGESGILKGDIILGIDGRKSETFDYVQLKNYLKQEGKTISTTIRRGNEIFSVPLTLREIL